MKLLLSLLTAAIVLGCTSIKQESPYSVITYEAGPCYGFCPIYKITINSDRTAILEAERFNFSQTRDSQQGEGTYRTVIKNEQYRQLLHLIEVLQPLKLNEFYGNRNVSDLPTSYLTLRYQNGSQKKVEDYGKQGTPELQELYAFFDELKTNQNWTKNQ